MSLIKQVKRTGHTGIVNVQGDGEFLVRNLQLETDIVKIDSSGVMSASGQGLTDGQGAGSSHGGGGYGGRGGANAVTGKSEL